MWLVDWISGWFVELPQRAGGDGLAAAKDALREPVAKAVAEENERKRKEEEAHRDNGVRFSRGDIDIGSSNRRYSLEGIPKSVFDGDAAKAKAVSAQLAAKPKYEMRKTFSEALLELVVAKCDGIAPMAYKRAGISRQVYSRVISTYCAKVEKLTAMRLCIGLQLSWEESVELLKVAGYAFSDSLPMDLVFSYCIKHRLFNIFDVNTLVESSGLRPFDIVF